MSRPVPNALFMTELSAWGQKALRRTLPTPVLLAAQPWAPMAIFCGADEPDIHVLDRKKGELVRKLELPPGARKGTDFRHFNFSPDGLCAAAYNSLDSSFAVWSLVDGSLKNHAEGMKQIPPVMCFMPGGRIALCDGPKINTFTLGGTLLHTTPISDDLRSLLLFAPPSPRPVLVGVAVFRKGLGGHHLHSFHIENGIITGRQEGPYRPRPDKPDDNRLINLFELLNIPGSTERILVVSEEEKLEKKASHRDWEYDYEYTTRILAVDPRRGMFYPSEVELQGQHCLEQGDSELRVIDEQGRRRRVTGFPLMLQNADWRLAE
ncbi:hypothetical protein BH09SUM1_BH09SUM1_09570 [soil metagenome]